MKLIKTKIFKSRDLPFLEARFVKESVFHYSKHFHETLSIGAVEEGVVSYNHNEKNYILKQNELAIINPYEVHCCNPIENQSRTYHMIYIDKNWCRDIQSSLFENINEYIPILNTNIHDEIMYKKYLKVNYILLNDDYLNIQKESSLYEFLEELFLKYCDAKINKNIEKSSLVIEKSIEFMNENLGENITVKEIANHVNLSEFYFIKSFKKINNITPHSFLLNLRVNKAKKLLSKNIDISQVAQEVGFFDQSHLSNAFKNQVATTPHNYKKFVTKVMSYNNI